MGKAIDQIHVRLDLSDPEMDALDDGGFLSYPLDLDQQVIFDAVSFCGIELRGFAAVVQVISILMKQVMILTAMKLDPGGSVARIAQDERRRVALRGLVEKIREGAEVD